MERVFQVVVHDARGEPDPLPIMMDIQIIFQNWTLTILLAFKEVLDGRLITKTGWAREHVPHIIPSFFRYDDSDVNIDTRGVFSAWSAL